MKRVAFRIALRELIVGLVFVLSSVSFIQANLRVLTNQAGPISRSQSSSSNWIYFMEMARSIISSTNYSQSCLTERPGDDYSDGPIRRTCRLFTLSPQSGKTTLYAVTTPSSVVTALRMRSLVTKHNTAIVYLCLPKRPWQFESILAWMTCKDNVAQEMARSARWQECSIKTAL